MSEPVELDLEHVSRHFPGLGHFWTLFDNAGDSQIATGAVARINEILHREAA